MIRLIMALMFIIFGALSAQSEEVSIVNYIDKKPPVGLEGVTVFQVMDSGAYSNNAKFYLWSENNLAFLHIEPITQHYYINSGSRFTFTQGDNISNVTLERRSDDYDFIGNIYTPTTFLIGSNFCNYGLDFTSDFVLTTETIEFTYTPTDSSATPPDCPSCSQLPTMPGDTQAHRIVDYLGNDADAYFWIDNSTAYIRINPIADTFDFSYYSLTIIQYGMQVPVGFDNCGLSGGELSEATTFMMDSSSFGALFPLDTSREISIYDNMVPGVLLSLVTKLGDSNSSDIVKDSSIEYYFDKSPPVGALEKVLNSGEENEATLYSWIENNNTYIQWAPVNYIQFSSSSFYANQDKFKKDLTAKRTSTETGSFYGYIVEPITFKFLDNQNCLIFDSDCKFDLINSNYAMSVGVHNSATTCTNQVYSGTYYGDKPHPSGISPVRLIKDGIEADAYLWSENNTPYFRIEKVVADQNFTFDRNDFTIVQDNIVADSVESKLCSETNNWSLSLQSDITFKLESNPHEDFILNTDRSFYMHGSEWGAYTVAEYFTYLPDNSNPIPLKPWIVTKTPPSNATYLQIASEGAFTTYFLWKEDGKMFLNVVPPVALELGESYYPVSDLDIVQAGITYTQMFTTRADDSSVHPFFGAITGPVTFRLYMDWNLYSEEFDDTKAISLYDNTGDIENFNSIELKGVTVMPAIIMYLLN